MKVLIQKDMDRLRAAAMQRMNGWFTAATKPLRAPDAIAAVRNVKAAEASAILSFASVRSPLIDAEADARGMTKFELAREILSRREAESTALAALELERQRRQEKIRKSLTPLDLSDD